jgi:methyl-accepting chemotaxis protein
MLRKKLIHKILVITSITLCIGFAVMVISAAWLESRSTIDLQISNSRNLSAIITKHISDFVMRGEAEKLEPYLRDIREKEFIRELKVFDREGKIAGSRNGGIVPAVAEVLKSGKALERTEKRNGVNVFTSVFPLANKGRTDAAGSFPGAVLIETSLDAGHAGAGQLTMLLCAIGFFTFFLIIGALYLFFKKTIIREIEECGKFVAFLASGDGDLTVQIPVKSEDEIGRMADSINGLICKLREIISELYSQAEKIAISTCRISGETANTLRSAAEQKEQSVAVAVAAEEMSMTLGEVATNTQRAANLSQEVNTAAGAGMAAVGDTFSCMEIISGSVTETLRTVECLATSSAEIGEIITLIEDVADQTNLLALNAAIEAARAGEHGRGFAVVADEVKNLSAKTAESTKEIARIIRTIQEESSAATASIGAEKERVEEGVSKSIVARDSLENILSLVEESSNMIGQIACATEEQSVTTEEISSKIHHVSEAAGLVYSQMESSDTMLHQLAEATEQIYSTVGRFNVGNYHNTIKSYAFELSRRTEEALDNALASGKITMDKLFDRKYVPMPGTDPPKYTTAYDKLFDQVVSPLQEEILARDKGIAFAICVDDNGYVPSHNLRYSKPLTGDPEVDKVSNRTKRKFEDRTGIRAARNQEKFLLQTYKRDTGEVMNDISTPINIGGRHWGAVRIGCQVTT